MISFTSAKAAPYFDDPLEMLRACHGRILSQCDTLGKLAVHLSDNGCDQQAQQAAQNILRFFDTAGQFHHQDEEENLFPALRLSAGSDKSHLEKLLARLLQEHIGMLAAWGALRPALLQLSKGVPAPLDETADETTSHLTQLIIAPALVDNFVGRYAEHIAFEENELLPLAARILKSQQILELGKCMAARRGVS